MTGVESLNLQHISAMLCQSRDKATVKRTSANPGFPVNLLFGSVYFRWPMEFELHRVSQFVPSQVFLKISCLLSRAVRIDDKIFTTLGLGYLRFTLANDGPFCLSKGKVR